MHSDNNRPTTDTVDCIVLNLKEQIGTMADTTIPVMRAPAHLMSCGPNGTNLAARAKQPHPVDQMQRAATAGGASPLDLDAIRRLYGSGLTMRLATERRMAASVGGRLPGLDANPDSRAMLDTLTGEDMTIDFGDFLNRAENRPVVDASFKMGNGPVAEAGPHAAMEARLGL